MPLRAKTSLCNDVSSFFSAFVYELIVGLVVYQPALKTHRSWSLFALCMLIVITLAVMHQVFPQLRLFENSLFSFLLKMCQSMVTL